MLEFPSMPEQRPNTVTAKQIIRYAKSSRLRATRRWKIPLSVSFDLGFVAAMLEESINTGRVTLHQELTRYKKQLPETL